MRFRCPLTIAQSGGIGRGDAVWRARASPFLPARRSRAIAFDLEGREFLALNWGPVFTFSPAISMIVNCKTQKEIDELWKKLSADADAEQCGWLKDRLGVSWQIVPASIGRMAADKNARKAERAMQAVLGMKKIDMKALKEAYARR